MLGAKPAVDYSLANRTLLFDLETSDWSEELINKARLDREKLPRTVPSGTCIGHVSPAMAEALHLPLQTAIVSGAHDQCANAVGCGVIESGSAVFGMGTFLCITPVFQQRKPAEVMIPQGINTEHHAVPGCFVSFLYNQGGALVKWFRDTFAATEYKNAQAQGSSIYPALFAELPDEPSSLFVLPHFTATGPPEFITDSSGVITGLHLETTRGEILKGTLEGVSFYLKSLVDTLPATGIPINDYRSVGGGSQSDAWVQLSADIFGKPFIRPVVTEAGALGAAIMAGIGSAIFQSYQAGVTAMVKLDRTFEPNLQRHQVYQKKVLKYQQLCSLMEDFLRN
jgi:xylulokinase